MAVNVCSCSVILSPNKKSILGFGMGSQILYFILFVGFLVSMSSADTEMTCVNVKNIFEKKGMLTMIDLQEQANSDADGLCSSKGCCGAAARSRLTQQARTQLEGSLRTELVKLADILGNKAKKFDEIFRKLLQLSREEFHAMFKRTYGMIYEQHSYVFVQLFEQLERYYTRGDSDFDVMMDSFFSILYQKMFTVLNSQYSFDEKYLKCVSEHMRDIQPFEDVPSKLSVQLRRAFVATRTFHKALRSGAEVVRNMVQVGVTQECVTAWARLRFCGSCGGDSALACSRYCHNVLRGCLPLQGDLSEQWDAYVDAVEKVADRLLGPFNIAMVVGPIDIKISEAIMSFQERNQEISQKIFSGCGKPVLGGGGSTGPFFAPDRARRSARSVPDFDWSQKSNDIDDFVIETSFESLVNDDPLMFGLRSPKDIKQTTKELMYQALSRSRFLQYMNGDISLQELDEHERQKRDAEPEAAGGEIDFRPYEFDGKRGSKKKKQPAGKLEDSHGAEGGPALERLVRETRARVRSSHHYWSHLPALLCSSASITSAPCFNGTHVATYTSIAAGDGTSALASNPEVRAVNAPHVSGPHVRTQLDTLRALTARLKDAYNGVEVHWKDTAEDLQAAASMDFTENIQGSGSGSGDHIDEEFTDDEDGDDYPEGSGDHTSRVEPEPEINEPTIRQPIAEVPIVPNVVEGPETNNVQPRILDEIPDAGQPETPPTGQETVREQPVAGSADRPSLQKALFTYALPVVCAWFGTIVTDLF
ncbi:glypican-1 [Leptidea sinapis]|uniref:glypican-1 n=1 Tax=Leptidea sinapis TaxID=189913 RepID=UPI00213BB0CF|nr:glypican-1 [Leptidea sinapis]